MSTCTNQETIHDKVLGSTKNWKIWPHWSTFLSGNNWLELRSWCLSWTITSSVAYHTLQHFLLCHMGMYLPQDLCISCSLCLEHSQRAAYLILSFFHGPIEMSPLDRAFPCALFKIMSLLSIPWHCLFSSLLVLLYYFSWYYFITTWSICLLMAGRIAEWLKGGTLDPYCLCSEHRSSVY